MQIITVKFKAKPDCIDELKTFLSSVVEPALNNKGCIKHDLHQGADNPDEFMFYEIWESEEDHEAHVNTPFVLKWREQLANTTLLAKPYEVNMWHSV